MYIYIYAKYHNIYIYIYHLFPIAYTLSAYAVFSSLKARIAEKIRSNLDMHKKRMTRRKDVFMGLAPIGNKQ